MSAVNSRPLLWVAFWLYDCGAITREQYAHVHQRITEATEAARPVDPPPHPDELPRGDEP